MKQYIGKQFVIRKDFDAITRASVFLKSIISKGPFTVNKVYGTGDDVGIIEIIDFEGVYHRAQEGEFKDWWCLFRGGEFESKCKEYVEPNEEQGDSNVVDKYFVVSYPETAQDKVSYYGPFDHESAKRFALSKKRSTTDNTFVGIAKLISEVKLSVEITDY